MGLPHWGTPLLETVGPYGFEGRLTTAMTGHPDEDPVTGELHLFGTGFATPYPTYHRVTAEGLLLDSRPIDVPGPTMMHDFAITENHHTDGIGQLARDLLENTSLPGWLRTP
ncbi:carotenoid oxygenase family protein [Streptomyces inhibens]|uniref:carotenoid oxygenase family protein n=1 Tax=Streptomyces inhibens TaxID=2293571 RepID=UPI0036D1C0A5